MLLLLLSLPNAYLLVNIKIVHIWPRECQAENCILFEYIFLNKTTSEMAKTRVRNKKSATTNLKLYGLTSRMVAFLSLLFYYFSFQVSSESPDDNESDDRIYICICERNFK